MLDSRGKWVAIPKPLAAIEASRSSQGQVSLDVRVADLEARLAEAQHECDELFAAADANFQQLCVAREQLVRYKSKQEEPHHQAAEAAHREAPETPHSPQVPRSGGATMHSAERGVQERQREVVHECTAKNRRKRGASRGVT